jgi:hypothetical protein
MLRRAPNPLPGREAAEKAIDALLPHASIHFRLKAWREFQRALDPLAPPKPIRRPERNS